MMCTHRDIVATSRAPKRICRNSLISPIGLFKLVASHFEDILGDNLRVHEVHGISPQT
jgi:hypothetical protein